MSRTRAFVLLSMVAVAAFGLLLLAQLRSSEAKSAFPRRLIALASVPDIGEDVDIYSEDISPSDEGGFPTAEEREAYVSDDPSLTKVRDGQLSSGSTGQDGTGGSTAQDEAEADLRTEQLSSEMIDAQTFQIEPVDGPPDAPLEPTTLTTAKTSQNDQKPAPLPSPSGFIERGDRTHISCQVLLDGFSLCVYENACFRMYTKEVGIARPLLHDRLPRLVGDATVWDDRGTTELRAPSWVSHTGTAGTISEALSNYGNYAQLGQLDFSYKDSADLGMASRPLLVPHQHLKEGVARPVPRWRHVAKPGAAKGGGGDGEGSRGGSKRKTGAGGKRGGGGGGGSEWDPASLTVWVDNLLVSSAVYAFRKQLWGTGASITFPLLSALVANASLHLGLPPPEFVLVSTEMRPAVISDSLEGRFGWNGGLLKALLTAAAGAPPVTGRQAFSAGRGGNGGGREGFLSHPGGGLGPIVLSQADDIPSLAELRVPMPDRAQPQVGARKDVPPPPPVTVCARRATLLGHKPSFVGGAAEANALRQILGGQLGLRFPFPGGGEDPKGGPPRVLVVDRGREDRPFANAADVVALVRGYASEVPGLTVNYMDGPSYGRLSFEEQAALFNGHSVVIAAHGAALSNVVFMPPRSAVIEVYPRGVWKPVYAKIASALGHTHLPVFSFQGGGKRHANAPAVKIEDKGSCAAMSYPRLTRDVCYAWVRALPVAVPLGALEQALVGALNLVSYSRVEHRGVAHSLKAPQQQQQQGAQAQQGASAAGGGSAATGELSLGEALSSGIGRRRPRVRRRDR